jgi:hypothetical protein
MSGQQPYSLPLFGSGPTILNPATGSPIPGPVREPIEGRRYVPLSVTIPAASVIAQLAVNCVDAGITQICGMFIDNSANPFGVTIQITDTNEIITVDPNTQLRTPILTGLLNFQAIVNCDNPAAVTVPFKVLNFIPTREETIAINTNTTQFSAPYLAFNGTLGTSKTLLAGTALTRTGIEVTFYGGNNSTAYGGLLWGLENGAVDSSATYFFFTVIPSNGADFYSRFQVGDKPRMPTTSLWAEFSQTGVEITVAEYFI